MKNQFRKLVCLLLSTILLVSGSGLIIGKMTCLKTGKSLVQMSASQNCCGEKPSKIVLQKKCCDLKNMVFTPANYVSGTHLVFKTQFSSSHLFACNLISSPCFGVVASDYVAIHSPPPRLQGQSPLYFTRSFRV